MLFHVYRYKYKYIYTRLEVDRGWAVRKMHQRHYEAFLSVQRAVEVSNRLDSVVYIRSLRAESAVPLGRRAVHRMALTV